MARQSYPPAPPPVDISGKEDIANKKSSLSDSEIFYQNVRNTTDAISGFEVTTNKDTLAIRLLIILLQKRFMMFGGL